jgi:hypothetical protein
MLWLMASKRGRQQLQIESGLSGTGLELNSKDSIDEVLSE